MKQTDRYQTVALYFILYTLYASDSALLTTIVHVYKLYLLTYLLSAMDVTSVICHLPATTSSSTVSIRICI